MTNVMKLVPQSKIITMHGNFGQQSAIFITKVMEFFHVIKNNCHEWHFSIAQCWFQNENDEPFTS